MRRMVVWRLGIVALAGASVAGCELIIGNFPGDDSSNTASATSSGVGGAGGTGGFGGSTSSGHTGGGGSPPAPLPGTAVWAYSIGTTGSDVVNAMAFGEVSKHLYITGKSDSDGDFGCDIKMGSTDAAGGGYLIEVDESGHCVWGLFFGKGTEGTGLSLDTNENIALTGTFQANLSVLGYSNGKAAGSSFIARITNGKTLSWAHSLSSDAPNTATTTGIVMDANLVFVSGHMSGKLDIDTTTVVSTPTGGNDGFIVKCDVANATGCTAYAKIIGKTAMNQEVLGLALSADGTEISFAGTSAGDTGFNSATLTPTPMTSDVSQNAIVGSFEVSTIFGARSAIFGDDKVQTGQRVAYGKSGTAPLFFAGTYDGSIKLGGDPAVTNAGGTSVFLARFEAGASSASATAFLTSTNGMAEEISALVTSTNDTVFIAGTLNGMTTLGSHPANGKGGGDAYVAKLDANLTPVWFKAYGDIDAQSARALAVSKDGKAVYVAGQFQGTVDFGNKHSVVNSTDKDDIFFAKLVP